MLGLNNLIGKNINDEVIIAVDEDETGIKGQSLIYIRTDKGHLYEPQYNRLPEFCELIDIVNLDPNVTIIGLTSCLLYDKYNPIGMKKVGTFVIPLKLVK